MKVIFDAYRSCTFRGYHLRFDVMHSGLGPDKLTAQLDAVVRNGRTDGFILTPPLTDDPDIIAYFEARNIRYVRRAG